MNLGYRIIYARHPYVRAAGLGLIWKHVTYLPLNDLVYFWGCNTLPERPLPEGFFRISDNPHKYVGFGLTKEEADLIEKLLYS